MRHTPHVHQRSRRIGRSPSPVARSPLHDSRAHSADGDRDRRAGAPRRSHESARRQRHRRARAAHQHAAAGRAGAPCRARVQAPGDLLLSRDARPARAHRSTPRVPRRRAPRRSRRSRPSTDVRAAGVRARHERPRVVGADVVRSREGNRDQHAERPDPARRALRRRPRRRTCSSPRWRRGAIRRSRSPRCAAAR